MIGLELSPVLRAALPQDPLAAYFAPPVTQGGVAVGHGPQAGVTVWTMTGPDTAACLRYDAGDGTQRLSWRETLICVLRKIYPAGGFTLSAGWAQLQSSGSGLGGSYTGNRAVSTSSAGAVATVQVARAQPYDLWIYYTARTAGGYLRVEIDGGQDLVDAIGDPAGLGFKAFSTYGPVDMQRRRAIKVATGLSGPHTVTLSHGGPASPGGTTLMIEALGLSADLRDDAILPPLWQPGTAYVMGDEVQWQGTFYAARATGISGTLPPAHLTGIAGDGGIDWRADNRPTYPQFQAVDYASEREYALRLVSAGQATEIGGQTHGNDLVRSRDLQVDGAAFVAPLAGTGLHLGDQITLTETTDWQRSGGGIFGTCTLARRITAGTVDHAVSLQFSGPPAVVDWCYIGMVPFVHWDGESASTAFHSVTVPGAGEIALAEYAGQAAGTLAGAAPGGRALRCALAGRTPQGAVLRYGCEVLLDRSAGQPFASLSAQLRPNLEARQAAGAGDWTGKLYLAAALPAGQALQAGDRIGFSCRHRIGATQAQA